MKNVTLATLFVFLTTLITPPAVSIAAAQTQGQQAVAAPSLAIPISVPDFTGTLTLKRFTVIDGVVNAVGMLVGTATTPTGPVPIARTVSIPVALVNPATCDILHLELGPLDLDLLGLVVHLDKIVLDIDAQSGPGNLLGNLLCSVAGLLDNPGGLARLLNQILQILG
jgi:hypothetical protein